MTASPALVATALILAAACTVDGQDTTPADTCLDLVEVTCAKLVECYPPDTLAAAGVPATAEECVAATGTALACESQTEETACPAGRTYDPGMAQSCLAEYAALTCEQIEGRLKDNLPSCAQACR